MDLDIRIRLQVTTNVRVTHPLHDKVVHLLTDEAEPTHKLSAVSVTRLNKALAQSTILWQLAGTAVLGLGSEIVVKIGYSIDVDHISTLNYIKEHAPNIPTPDVYGVLATDTRKYFFMSRIHGEPLDTLWETLSEMQKSSIRDQLTSILQDIRVIPFPKDGELALGGGSPRRCKDIRRHERVAEGPIVNETEFNDFLFDTNGRKTVSSAAKMLRSFLRSDHRMVMTHSDLHPRNILVAVAQERHVRNRNSEATEVIKPSQVKIVGLIDWETSGWYPEYWEYVKALHTIAPGDGLDDWWAYLPTTAIGTWPGDFAIDVMISRWAD